MTAGDTDSLRDLENLPTAYKAWRKSALGQITGALEQNLVLDRVGPLAGLRVLDVGCGDGLLALEMARRGAQATSVDASGRMIAAAQERTTRLGQRAL